MIYTIPNKTQKGEGEREKGKKRREKLKIESNRCRSSTLSSSLITIHFFDYINARKKNETSEV